MTRNRTTARSAGQRWETAIVSFLVECGWRYAERRRLSGANDKGDISGLPGVVIEAKDVAAIRLSEFVDEAETEKDNANAAVGVAWIKRKGKSDPGEAYVVMTGNQFATLLRDAGY